MNQLNPLLNAHRQRRRAYRHSLIRTVHLAR
jgi:hypothetical protein